MEMALKNNLREAIFGSLIIWCGDKDIGTAIPILSSRRGQPLVYLDGYSFSCGCKQLHKGDRITWYCSTGIGRLKCTARLQTIRNFITFCKNEHTHPPPRSSYIVPQYLQQQPADVAISQQNLAQAQTGLKNSNESQSVSYSSPPS